MSSSHSFTPSATFRIYLCPACIRHHTCRRRRLNRTRYTGAWFTGSNILDLLRPVLFSIRHVRIRRLPIHFFGERVHLRVPPHSHKDELPVNLRSVHVRIQHTTKIVVIVSKPNVRYQLVTHTLCPRVPRTTPLIFLAKFLFKLYMYGSDRTVVIKIPLIRNVMPKRDLAVFLRGRDERRSGRRQVARKLSRSASAPSSAGELT